MMVSDREHDAMAAIRKVVLLGFIGAGIGDLDLPDVLVYGRRNGDVVDAVRVFGPDESEAARLVHGKLVQEVSGTLSHVVDAIAGWSSK